MTRRRFIAASLVSLGAAALGIPSAEGRQAEASRAVERFAQRVAEYAARVKALERALPPLEMSHDMREIHRAVEARATAIRRLRRHARAGDLFAADVSDEFRRRIRGAIARSGISAEDFDDEPDEGGGVPARPVVNGRFHWETATPVPAAILAALPSLPAALQYRFVGRDLALIDADAGVILDVLPHALAFPAPTPASSATCRGAQPPRVALRS